MNGGRGKSNPAVLWILHFAFVMSIPIYGVVLQFLGEPAKDSGGAFNSRFFLAIFAGISVMQIVLAVTVDRWMTPGAAAGPNPTVGASTYLERAIVRTVIADALIESIAIYGLVGVFLGFERWWSYAFMGAALLIMLIRVAAVRNISDTYQHLRASEGRG